MLLKKQDEYRNYLQVLLDMRHDTQDLNFRNLAYLNPFFYVNICSWEVLFFTLLHRFLASLVALSVSWKHRNNDLKIVLKYSILSLFTKFHPLVFQLRQKENFPVLESEIGFWELRLGILGALSKWLLFITFTKLNELSLYYWMFY